MTLASVCHDDGVVVRSARVNGFTLRELQFPPNHAHGSFDPPEPYVAVVLDGRMVKHFTRKDRELGLAAALSIPAGAEHSAQFGRAGAHVLTVGTSDGAAVADVLRVDGDVVSLAWRLARELRSTDAAAPLAAESLSLELVAAAARSSVRAASRRAAPPWLRAAEELLRTSLGRHVSLTEVAAAVAVHPAHVARTFRVHHGLSVGEFARQVRLDWATREVARTDTPLASIAARAGFADQAHFTRLFKRRLGVTPARYRRELKA